MKIFGFSLIEILIVLGIIAILTLLAVPYYGEFMVRENRMEAKAMLFRLASAMERFYFTTSSYSGADLKAFNIPEYTANNSYHLSIQYADTHGFLLTAYPLGKQADKDQACGALVLNSQRKKLVTGSARSEDCWG